MAVSGVPGWRLSLMRDVIGDDVGLRAPVVFCFAPDPDCGEAIVAFLSGSSAMTPAELLEAAADYVRDDEPVVSGFGLWTESEFVSPVNGRRRLADTLITRCGDMLWTMAYVDGFIAEPLIGSQVDPLIDAFAY